MTPKLKAYQVTDNDEGNSCICFATNSATARREGAQQLDTEWDGIDTCRRANWADQYAPGPVPMLACLAAGWWFECSHCGCRMDSDGRHGEEEDERDDAFEPTEEPHSIYCSPTCRMELWADRRARDAKRDATIEACAIKWPDATAITAHELYTGTGTQTHWTASFGFPGGKFHANWKLGDKVVSVSACDVEAFKAWTGVE